MKKISIVSVMYYSEIAPNNFVNSKILSYEAYNEMLRYRSEVLNRLGLEHIIFTNEQNKLPALTNYTNIKIEEIEINSSLQNNIKFYAAHAKLNAISRIAEKAVEETMYLMLDLDVAFHETKLYRIEELENYDLVLYDIFREMYQNSMNKNIKSDLYEMGLKIQDIKVWCGGEFVYLNKNGAIALNKLINSGYLKYIDNINKNKINFFGDELLLSFAANKLKSNGLKIKILDKNNKWIRRYWSIPVLHKKESFDLIKTMNVPLIHLPADKQYFVNLTFHTSIKYLFYLVKRFFNKIYFIQ